MQALNHPALDMETYHVAPSFEKRLVITNGLCHQQRPKAEGRLQVSGLDWNGRILGHICSHLHKQVSTRIALWL